MCVVIATQHIRRYVLGKQSYIYMKQNGNKKSAAKNKAVRPSYAANIKVVGVGGGGCSAVSRMRDSMDLKGIDFIAINTDVQDLDYCNAKKP